MSNNFKDPSQALHDLGIAGPNTLPPMREVQTMTFTLKNGETFTIEKDEDDDYSVYTNSPHVNEEIQGTSQDMFETFFGPHPYL